MVDDRLNFKKELLLVNVEIERKLFLRFMDDINERAHLKVSTVTNGDLFDELSAGMTTWMPWGLTIQSTTDA